MEPGVDASQAREPRVDGPTIQEPRRGDGGGQGRQPCGWGAACRANRRVDLSSGGAASTREAGGGD